MQEGTSDRDKRLFEWEEGTWDRTVDVPLRLQTGEAKYGALWGGGGGSGALVDPDHRQDSNGRGSHPMRIMKHPEVSQSPELFQVSIAGC